jgi:hypothetical protein
MTTNLARTRSTLRIVATVATALALGSAERVHGSGAAIVADSTRTQRSHPAEKRSFRPGVCDRDAEKLLNQKPVRIKSSARAPKKTRDVQPKYPELPPGTTGRGMWMGEALIDSSGRVVRVWPVREVEFTPPFPSFNRAIADAIRQWEFEPLIEQAKPTPVCMTVTVNINWR